MANHSIHTILQPSAVLRRLVLSWLIAVTLSYLVLPQDLQSLSNLDGLTQMSLGAVCVMTCIFFIAFNLIGYFTNSVQIERWLIVSVFTILSVVSIFTNFHWAYFVTCGIVTLILIVYALKGWNNQSEQSHQFQRSPLVYKITLLLVACLFVLFVSIWTVCRIYSFCTPTYDFGIFSQMFYNMRNSGIPYTTVERDGLLSHFQVHVSPIYYLLLPFYYIFPFPATLQIMQALVLASAVIPLWLICRKRGLHSIITLVLCATLLLYPAYSGGTSYDIHENAFLAPILLWLFYGIERKYTGIIILFSCLCLLVKEDAAVYTALIALYLIAKSALHTKDSRRIWGMITGSLLLCGSIIWFGIVTRYLSVSGDGVMTYRYQNFMYDGSGSLITVIKSVLLCPLKTIYECVDKEKVKFILQTLLPLLCLPLFTRRYERYILLIPYVLINLMSDYQYQHDIMFQYTFGSTACLIYLTAINLADLKNAWKQGLLASISLALCVVLFVDTIVPIATRYPRLYRNNQELYDRTRQMLQLIPDDANVSATTFYTTELSNRKVLYDVKYTSEEHLLSSDYVALAVNSATNYIRYETETNSGFENVCMLLEENGFEVFAQLEDTLVIYRKDS